LRRRRTNTRGATTDINVVKKEGGATKVEDNDNEIEVGK
jgi:hypothetical protein